MHQPQRIVLIGLVQDPHKRPMMVITRSKIRLRIEHLPQHVIEDGRTAYHVLVNSLYPLPSGCRQLAALSEGVCNLNTLRKGTSDCAEMPIVIPPGLSLLLVNEGRPEKRPGRSSSSLPACPGLRGHSSHVPFNGTSALKWNTPNTYEQFCSIRGGTRCVARGITSFQTLYDE